MYLLLIQGYLDLVLVSHFSLSPPKIGGELGPVLCFLPCGHRLYYQLGVDEYGFHSAVAAPLGAG